MPIDLEGRLRRLATAVVAPIVSLAALIASLGNPTADMGDVTQADDGSLAAYLKELRLHTRGHNQTRICLIVPDLANIASDAPNLAILAELDYISSVALLDQTGVDAGAEGWGFYDLVVVGSDTYAGFNNANLDDLILLKIPVMVCNSAVAEHLKMGTDTTQSANTVNEWCKTISNRITFLVFGSIGDKALFSVPTVSDRLDMSDVSLHEHLLMTSLTGDTNSTAVLCSLMMESGAGALYTLDDNTEMPSSRMFAGCFVNADKLTTLGKQLLRRTARNEIQAGVTPSITLKANASLLSKIYQDTNDIQPNVEDIHDVDLPAVKTVVDAITAAGPTNTQMETARDAIIAEVDANETKIDDLDDDLGTHNTALTNHESSQSTHRAVLVDIHDTDLPAVKTVVDNIEALVAATVAGKPQIIQISEDWDSTPAGTYAWVTAVGQDVLVESLAFYTTRDLSGDAWSGLSIQTDATTPRVIVSQANGVKANLTAKGQISNDVESCPFILKQGTYIEFTTYDGAIAGVATLVDIVITYKAVVSGGYIA